MCFRSFVRSSVAAGCIALLAFASSRAIAAAPVRAAAVPVPDATALIKRVAATFAEQARGVFGFRSHATVRSAERILPHDQVEDAWFVFSDGRLVKSGGTPGGPASAETAAHQPYDVRYVGEYRFASTACARCAPGTVAIAYDSPVHDAVHGRGQLTIDAQTARILTQTTQPFVVPKPARTGSLATTWAETPAGWYPVSTVGTFIGRVGPLSARATLTQQFTNYRRYAEVILAERALDTRVSR